MIFRPARMVLLGLMIIMAWPNSNASTDETMTVDEKIDRIIEPPEYDWLRGESGPGSEGTEDGIKGSGSAGPASSKRPDRSGCDFSPSVSRSPKKQASKPASRSCGGGPTDCSRSPVSSCDCGPHVGSCGAPGIGMLSSLGYLMVGLFLAVLIGMTVAAIVKRRQRIPEETALDVDDIHSPGDVRPSQVPKFSVSAMMERAWTAARAGDFKNAVGFAYLAGIDHLHRAGLVDLRRSTTNLQILDAVSRANGLHPSAAVLIRTFEDLFFGGYVAKPGHWEACRKIVEEEFAKTPIQD